MGLGIYIGLENAKKEGKYSKYSILVLFLCLENFQTKFTVVFIELKENC